MKNLKVALSGKGFKIQAFVQKLGKDLLVSLWGGTQPHIGAVGMAIPRPSLKDPQEWSATSSNFTFPDHKEDLLVKRISEKIASQCRVRVVVAAGLHWDNLTPSQIRRVETLTSELGDLIIKRLKKES